MVMSRACHVSNVNILPSGPSSSILASVNPDPPLFAKQLMSRSNGSDGFSRVRSAPDCQPNLEGAVPPQPSFGSPVHPHQTCAFLSAGQVPPVVLPLVMVKVSGSIHAALVLLIQRAVYLPALVI